MLGRGLPVAWDLHNGAGNERRTTVWIQREKKKEPESHKFAWSKSLGEGRQNGERTGAAEAELARQRHKMASFIFAGL